ncbi:MAG: hypothetical protein IKH46_02805 [Lachnospiraceae bacterium]|nr:hypothetical protein [Lachnospiraceae bacterium]
MNEENKVKEKDYLMGALIVIGLVGVFAADYYLGNAAFRFKPQVMIGEQGLYEMRKFLHLLILSQVFLLIGQPAFLVMLGYIYFRVKKLQIRPMILGILAVVGIFFALGSVPLRITGVELQGERFSDSKLMQIFYLLDAVNKDMEAEPVVVCENASIIADSRAYTHTYSSGRGRSSTSRLYEFYLLEVDSKNIVQISREEYEELEPGMKALPVHTLRCYPNSGLLYALDGYTADDIAEFPDEEQAMESLYTLTYGEDGYLHWEKNSAGKEVSGLGMNYYIDGELRLNRAVENVTMDRPFFIDGRENTAYLTVVYSGGFRRVSNIVSVTHPIEPEKLDLRHEEIYGNVTETQNGKTVTFYPYGIVLELPEDMDPVFRSTLTWEDADSRKETIMTVNDQELSVTVQWERHLYYRDPHILATQSESDYDYNETELKKCGDGWTLHIYPRNEKQEHIFQYFINIREDEFLCVQITYPQSESQEKAEAIVDSLQIVALDDPQYEFNTTGKSEELASAQDTNDTENGNASTEEMIDLIPQTDTEKNVNSDYFVTSEGLVIAKDAPHYGDVKKAVEALANAKELTIGSEFKKWYPVACLSFRSSDDDTRFIIYMNGDVEKYDEAPQSEADVYYHISGRIGGEEIDRYVAYDPELSSLFEAQKQSKAEQIRDICKRDGELQAHLFFPVSNNMVELTADGYGRFIVMYDPEETELNVMSGSDTLIRVYDVRPATAKDAEGSEYKPDVVGKLEVLK